MEMKGRGVKVANGASIRPLGIEASTHPTRQAQKEKAGGYAPEDN
jgi:hypothetical protein